MVTNQSQASMQMHLSPAWTCCGPGPCNCFRANHMYIRNGWSDHMSVTIKMDRVDDRLHRLLGVGSLSSSSASHTCSLLGSREHHTVLGALAAAAEPTTPSLASSRGTNQEPLCEFLMTRLHRRLGSLSSSSLVGSRAHYAIPSQLQGHKTGTSVRVPGAVIHAELSCWR